MRKSLILMAVFFSFYSCFQPERNCSDFKTGTYEFETYLSGELVTSRFVRNDSIEIDYFQGNTDTSSVRWLNDCEYILKNLNPKNMAEEKPIHMKILTTSKDGYTFEYGVVGESRKERGSVKRVEN
ncbi:MAG TPA: DNA topoisomerase IV [Salegentibacter sp.]|uniref:DNA topoisomerase IV n=1 Tax=Salegentibacter sp. TaxID=1903072 RepID=UPI002F92BAF2